MTTKAERGTKRTCGECGGKFYDLNKDPIVCPLCETVFVPEKLAVSKAPEEPKPAEPEKKAKPVEEEPVEKDSPEFISLEDADAEQGASEDTDVDEDVIVDLGDDDEDIPDEEDDDKFLEDDEEGGADVSDILPTKVESGDET